MSFYSNLISVFTGDPEQKKGLLRYLRKGPYKILLKEYPKINTSTRKNHEICWNWQ